MRHISPDLFKDSFVGRLTVEARLLWIGLVVRMADDQGRFADDADEIAVSIFPYDPHITPQIIDKWLATFANHHKLLRYRAGTNGSGRKLIQLLNWWIYQKSAQWAAVSKFPAPPRWIDRVRTHQDQKIVTRNWEKEGGYSKALRSIVARRTNVGPTKGQRTASAGPGKVKEEVNTEVDIDTEVKNPSLPPTSLQPQRGRKADGRTEIAAQIKKILIASSFEDKRKTDSISVQVAMRIVDGNPIHYVIASFASAHANGRSRDPIAVAVHQLEHDKVNPAFLDPSTWRSVPVAVLRSAGIDDLSAYAAQWKTQQFLKG